MIELIFHYMHMVEFYPKYSNLCFINKLMTFNKIYLVEILRKELTG